MHAVLTRTIQWKYALASLDRLIAHRFQHSFADAKASQVESLSDPSLVDASKARADWDPQSAVVYPCVLSKQNEDQLQTELTRRFQRRRYERNHWDSAIQGFREVELFQEDDCLRPILEPIRSIIEQRHSSPTLAANQLFSGTWLPCHSIDLHETGALNAHVDSVRFSGNIVAGLSLRSDSIMRLRPVESSESADTTSPIDSCVDLMLPARSLYVLSGQSRYEYTHELLPSGDMFRSTRVERGSRLSVIFRDAKTLE